MYNNISGIPSNFITIIDKIISSKLACLNISCSNPNNKTYVQDDEPTAPVEGDSWYDTGNDTFYVYVNGTWTDVGTGGAKPEDCCPAENGMNLDTGTYKLGGDLTEDTTISAITETFTVQRNPTGDDSYVISLDNIGTEKLAAGYVNLANPTTDSKVLLAFPSVIGLTAADDNTVEYTGISAYGNQATMTYTDQAGGGVGNSSVKASNGLVTLDAPLIFLDGELIQLDGSTDIVMESQQELKVTTEDTAGANTKGITIKTGDNSAGNTGSISINPGEATNGNGGFVTISSGKSLTTGIGGNIVITPSTGGTTDGVLILENLPTFADEAAAAALATNTVYKTATGELRIKL